MHHTPNKIKNMITIEEIKQMSNLELLELYTDKVRCDHYDPGVTPPDVQELYESKISADDLEKEVLSRMT
jgi:hypothetical protein